MFLWLESIELNIFGQGIWGREDWGAKWGMGINVPWIIMQKQSGGHSMNHWLNETSIYESCSGDFRGGGTDNDWMELSCTATEGWWLHVGQNTGITLRLNYSREKKNNNPSEKSNAISLYYLGNKIYKLGIFSVKKKFHPKILRELSLCKEVSRSVSGTACCVEVWLLLLITEKKNAHCYFQNDSLSRHQTIVQVPAPIIDRLRLLRKPK